MIYDFLDFAILNQILEKKDTSTWEIAENFDWGDKPNFKDKREQERFLTKKSDKIGKRLKRMSEEGLVKIYKNGKSVGNKNMFLVNSKKVLITKHKFPDGFSKALFIKEKDKKWQIFEL